MAAAAESPLSQFKIEPIIPIHIGGLDLSFTNASAWMLVAVGVASLILWIGLRAPKLVPGRSQALVEALAGQVDETIMQATGPEGRQYFGLIFAVFLFILIANLVGLLPYSYTVTSQIIVNFAMAGTAFVLITLIGIIKQGTGFLKMFVPSGVPIWLLPLLTVIELISYFIRPITLSVRLFANMMAGHVLLKVLAGFVVMLGVFGALPLLAISGMFALELLVAVLQAYVFTVLICVYLNDALHQHH